MQSLPLCPRLCLTPSGSKPQRYERCFSIDSLWWFSRLDGAEGLLGQGWNRSGQAVPSSESLVWVFTCLCAPLCLWRWTVLDGLIALWWTLEKPGKLLFSLPPPRLSLLLYGDAEQFFSHNNFSCIFLALVYLVLIIAWVESVTSFGIEAYISRKAYGYLAEAMQWSTVRIKNVLNPWIL